MLLLLCLFRVLDCPACLKCLFAPLVLIFFGLGLRLELELGLRLGLGLGLWLGLSCLLAHVFFCQAVPLSFDSIPYCSLLCFGGYKSI